MQAWSQRLFRPQLGSATTHNQIDSALRGFLLGFLHHGVSAGRRSRSRRHPRSRQRRGRDWKRTSCQQSISKGTQTPAARKKKGARRDEHIVQPLVQNAPLCPRFRLLLLRLLLPLLELRLLRLDQDLGQLRLLERSNTVRAGGRALGKGLLGFERDHGSPTRRPRSFEGLSNLDAPGRRGDSGAAPTQEARGIDSIKGVGGGVGGGQSRSGGGRHGWRKSVAGGAVALGVSG